MEEKLVFRYDRVGDILYIEKRPPNSLQETQELGDDVVARLNPVSGEIEILEVLFFSTRLLQENVLTIPVEARMRRWEHASSEETPGK